MKLEDREEEKAWLVLRDDAEVGRAVDFWWGNHLQGTHTSLTLHHCVYQAEVFNPVEENFEERS